MPLPFAIVLAVSLLHAGVSFRAPRGNPLASTADESDLLAASLAAQEFLPGSRSAAAPKGRLPYAPAALALWDARHFKRPFLLDDSFSASRRHASTLQAQRVCLQE